MEALYAKDLSEAFDYSDIFSRHRISYEIRNITVENQTAIQDKIFVHARFPAFKIAMSGEMKTP